MSKLTEAQIEAAAEAAFNGNEADGNLWDTQGPFVKRCWREGQILAAPHLQYPIADPTEEELCYFRNRSPFGYETIARTAIREFVRRRNNPPKPDPRREALKSAFASIQSGVLVSAEGWPDFMAKTALNALDALK